MTKKERTKPELLNASRRKRIAAGSGTEVSEVNKLMKQHRQMADMMKKMSKGKGGMAGAMASLMGGKMPGGMGGGMPYPSQMDPAQLERMAREMGIDPASLPAPDAAPQKELPKDVNQLIKSGGATPSLPGLGAPRFPGLPGLGGGAPGKKK